MFSFYISPGRLDKACSPSDSFCKTAFHQAYCILAKVWQRHTWQSTFSFSLPCKTAFHQAYLTKHVLFQFAFAKRHFTRPTWQTCSHSACFLQTGIPSGILDKACSLSACFCKTALHQAYLTKTTKHVLFQLVFGKRHFTRHTWQRMLSFSETIFHQAYLTKHERVWEGSGKLKMKHEKGVGCFMVHKSEVGTVWEGSKWFPQVFLGAPSHPTLRNHEKHPNHFSCFIFSLPKPFPPHSWEPWSTQTPFHASFLAFPNLSHPTLGNHEAPKPLFMLHF